MAGLPSGPVYVDCFFHGQEKFRIRGAAANCTWGLTVSDPVTQPCSLRPVLRLRLSKLANPLLKADGLSPANPIHECWNRHATKASEVRLASAIPSTLNPTCQPRAMTYSCSPRPARRGGSAIAFIITALPILFAIATCVGAASPTYNATAMPKT